MSFTSYPYQARAANKLPYLTVYNNSGVPQITKRYFYESNGQKETIVIVPLSYIGFCYKTYRYNYNFKTRQYTKKEGTAGDYVNIKSRQKLVNDKGLDLGIIENGKTLSFCANDEVVSAFDYPRRFLGTYVRDNISIVTYYLENILENGEKTSMLTSFTSALPSGYVPNEKKNLISLSPNTYPFILQEAIAAVPFNKNLYLITKNKIFKVSNGKILKVIPVANIVNYA